MATGKVLVSRLREEVEDYDINVDRLNAAVEIERLRSALEKIVDKDKVLAGTIRVAAEIAIEALSAENDWTNV